MHGERARSHEPPLVAGPLKQDEKCVSVSGGAVTQATAFLKRTGAPRQLAAGEREILVQERPERGNDPRRSVTPLHANPFVALGDKAQPSDPRPVDEAVLLDGVAAQRVRDAPDITQGENAASEPVRSVGFANSG
jgi:hypothetical protein